MLPRSTILQGLILTSAAMGSCAAQSNAPIDTSVAQVREVWRSTGADYNETDSLAAYRATSGDVRLFATCKKGNRVDVFDAATGRFSKSFGRTGKALGEFGYPNGIAVVHFAPPANASADESKPAVVVVVDRDNARVQCFRAEDLHPLASFGEGQLGKPYGVAVSYRDGSPTLYVTDAKPKDQYFVQTYRLKWSDGKVEAGYLHGFGDRTGPGAIREPESIVVDDAQGRILLCDEETLNVKVYSLDGQYSGKTFADGLIQGEPEGIVILDQPKGGVIVLTDQRKNVSVWHVFDRLTFRRLGSFTGEPVVANTDGICILPSAFGPFQGGALFAVNNDQDVRAYDLADILKHVKP